MARAEAAGLFRVELVKIRRGGARRLAPIRARSDPAPLLRAGSRLSKAVRGRFVRLDSPVPFARERDAYVGNDVVVTEVRHDLPHGEQAASLGEAGLVERNDHFPKTHEHRLRPEVKFKVKVEVKRCYV